MVKRSFFASPIYQANQEKKIVWLKNERGWGCILFCLHTSSGHSCPFRISIIAPCATNPGHANWQAIYQNRVLPLSFWVSLVAWAPASCSDWAGFCAFTGTCFFRFRWPTAAGSINGPDQAVKGPFWYGNTVLNEASEWPNEGSIRSEESNWCPTAPSWCGGGNFSLLLFAFACVIRRLLC